MKPALKVRGRLSQKLALRPDMIQSVRLLQMGGEELEAYLHQECERNPLLDLPDSVPAGRAPIAISPHSDARRPEEDIADRVTLAEHLQRQFGSTLRDPIDRALAHRIIASLDEDGYLRLDPASIASEAGVSDERFEQVLAEIQRMDPAGVAARDLAECLRLQLQEKAMFGAGFALLLANLPLLAAHRYRELAAACRVKQPVLLAMVQQLRALDPRPGRRFDSASVIPAVADAIIEFGPDGWLQARLNPGALPRLTVDQRYYRQLSARHCGSGERAFAKSCLGSAGNLLRSLDLRAQTILRVAREIAAHQPDFFRHGPGYLASLSQRDVAKVIGVHVSTVSRTIANKYLMTPRGLFKFSYFFDISLPGHGGEYAHGSEAVRHRIRELIACESADAILSDDTIVDILGREQIRIARRTVAKYRESMDIPSSHQRRRLRQAAG